MEVKNRAGQAGAVEQQGIIALFLSLIVYLTTLCTRAWETAKSFKENLANPELWRLFISSIPWYVHIDACLHRKYEYLQKSYLFIYFLSKFKCLVY